MKKLVVILAVSFLLVNLLAVFFPQILGMDTIPSWTSSGDDQVSASFGSSVASAGDVNGDGYSDVIIGAGWFDTANNCAGKAYLYLGSSSGLEPSASWTSSGDDQENAYFGRSSRSVASAGDVNGDGYSDVIIGADGYDTANINAGKAYLYLGSSSGLETSPSWTSSGDDQAYAYFGTSVTSAGDVNGDGYSDVIIGAYGYKSFTGKAYVYFGNSSGLQASPSWTSSGDDQVDAYFGSSLASAGDVNGDGYSDVIIGAHVYDTANCSAGKAYLYLGSSSGLGASPAWTSSGDDQVNAFFGQSVASAGDVNGDGYDDVIVSTPYYNTANTDAGKAYLYFGSETGLSSTPSWTSSEDDQADARFGQSVASAGDVNGDGYSDVIIGAYQYDTANIDAGKAYLYLGSSSGLEVSASWTSSGDDQASACFGKSVASAGDVNDDGYSDVIIGAYGYDTANTNVGKAYLYLGKPYGCVALYHFDEGSGTITYDSSGNDNQGTIYGAGWTTGVSGFALKFDGIDDYVEVQHSSDLNIGGNGKGFTVEAWIKIFGSSSPWQQIVRKGVGGIQYEFKTYPSGDQLRFIVYDGYNDPRIDAPITADDGNWHYVAATKSAIDNLLRIYFDGNLIGTSFSTCAGTEASTENLYIGAAGSPIGEYFNGKIDEGCIYNRALSPEEIKEHYGLVAYWDFDEGSGNVLHDKSSNGNDGTINGADWTTGISNSALSFDGVDDYVNCGIPKFNLTNRTTIIGWVKLKVNDVVLNVISEAKPSNCEYILNIGSEETGPTGKLGFFISTSGHGGPSGWEVFDSSSPVDTNRWVHFAGTYDDSTMNIYIDGEKDVSRSKSGNIYSGNARLFIGHADDGTSHYFNGLIDELRVYNRALSAEEIREHYELLTPPVAPTNLTADATGNSGEIALDWDNNIEIDLNHYSIYRRNDGDWNWIDNTTVSYYLDTGLMDGITYHYHVTASDKVPNESDPSNEANATPYSGAPIADAGPDQESFNGRIVNFNGSNSYDPDGTIVNWTWNFGDESDGYGMTTTHVYSTYGVYNATLTVKDNDGRTNTDIAIVTIWQNGHDLSILKVQSPHNVRMGSTKTVVVWVENLGIYNDYGLLSLTITAPDGTETILTTIVKERDGTSLNIGNKVRITFSVAFNQRGIWTFYAHVDISDSNGNINPFPLKDCNPDNNNGEPTHGTDCK